MGLDKRQRAEEKARKEKGTRKERRRMRMWFDQQARTFTDATYWDQKALADDNIEHYRDAVNRNNGMFGEDFETGRSSHRREMYEGHDE